MMEQTKENLLTSTRGLLLWNYWVIPVIIPLLELLEWKTLWMVFTKIFYIISCISKNKWAETFNFPSLYNFFLSPYSIFILLSFQL